MKKFFSTIFLFILLLFILLAVSGWYFNTNAEKIFKVYLQKNSEVSSKQTFRLELVDYRKTVFGAKARLKISSDIPLIADKMGEIDLIAKLLNGPIFVTKSGISMGAFRWFVTVDESDLTDAKKEILKALFPDVFPRFIIRADLDENIHYKAKLHTNFAEIDVAGVVDLKAEKNIGKVLLENLHTEFLSNQISVKQISVNYQRQKRSNPAYKPGNTVISIPRLKIKSKDLNNPIEISLEATSSISEADGYLNGYSKINLKLIDGKQQGDKVIPVDKASLSVMLKGLSSEGFLRYSELEAELDNLRQQAQWSLQENGEFPEGQDQIWQLYDQIDASSQRLPTIIFNELFNKDSLIQLKVESANASGQSSLVGMLTSLDVTNINEQACEGSICLKEQNVKKGGGGYKTLLSNLQGKAQVNLDSEFLIFLQNFSPIKQSEFKLILKDSKLLMQ